MGAIIFAEEAYAGASPAYWSSERGDAEVDFLLQGAEAVYPVEAKAERNLKAKSLRTYREFFGPPRCYRTSLERHHAGKLTEDVPLYAVGRIVAETGSGRLI